MNTKYTLAHGVATAIGLAAVTYQTAVILEAFDAASAVVKWGIPLATISAALLPVVSEAAWHQRERAKAAFLWLSILALVAFVLPSGISRLGEGQEAKISAAAASQADVAKLKADHDQASRLVTEAQAWVATECRTGNGPKCRGVTFTLDQRQAFREKLHGQITAAEAHKTTTPWLPTWHPALLPIGLELAVWGAFFYAFGPLARRSAITEREEPLTDEEIEGVRRTLRLKGQLNNDELAAEMGVTKSEASKRAQKAIDAGIVTKFKHGREVALMLN